MRWHFAMVGLILASHVFGQASDLNGRIQTDSALIRDHADGESRIESLAALAYLLNPTDNLYQIIGRDDMIEIQEGGPGLFRFGRVDIQSTYIYSSSETNNWRSVVGYLQRSSATAPHGDLFVDAELDEAGTTGSGLCGSSACAGLVGSFGGYLAAGGSWTRWITHGERQQLAYFKRIRCGWKAGWQTSQLIGEWTDSYSDVDSGVQYASPRHGISPTGWQGAYFDGTGDAYGLPNATDFGPGSGEISYVAWIRPEYNSAENTGTLFVDYGSQTYDTVVFRVQYQGGSTNTSFVFYLRDENQNKAENNTDYDYPYDQDYCFVGTWTGKVNRVYVNGVLAKAVTNAAVGAVNTVSGNGPTVGAWTPYNSNAGEYKGYVYVMSIYKRALTPSEVMTIYEAGPDGYNIGTVSTNELFAFWDGIGTLETDTCSFLWEGQDHDFAENDTTQERSRGAAATVIGDDVPMVGGIYRRRSRSTM